MTRVRTYPIASINDGIKVCLENTTRLLDFANKIFQEGNEDYAFIFYSFAVEEFGKAVLLERNKRLNKIEHTDDITFSDHEEKIKAAVSELKNRYISIPVYEDLEPTGEITVDEAGNIIFKGELTFQDMVQKGEFLDLNKRLDILFVDYNEKEKKWQTWKDTQLPRLSLGDSLAALKLESEKWAKLHGFHT